MASAITRLCRLLREIRDNGPGTRRELAATLDVNDSSMWHLLRVAMAEGVVCQDGMRGQAIVYGLAAQNWPAGQPYVRHPPRPARSRKAPHGVESLPHAVHPADGQHR